MNQWYDLLCAAFGETVGLIGGGYYEIEDLTVTTYSSAYRHMDRLGNRWGLVIFDECHHLPGDVYSHAAEMCLAPYRLGLTATPERADGRGGAARYPHRPTGVCQRDYRVGRGVFVRLRG